ncbi:sensor histidine kinase [Nocardioides marinquilinus]|uniref:sensor histidine kinase n=1 Tax=Nocardioides marinquilinus TaxID=1210400 RepID=UPI0031E69A80
MRRDLAAWAPEAVLGVALLLAGLLVDLEPSRGTDGSTLLVLLGTVAAAVLCRQVPAASLALVWVVGAYQLYTATPLLAVQLSVALVAYGCARWGDRWVLVASALSIPAGAAIGLTLVARFDYFPFEEASRTRRIVNLLQDLGLTGLVIVLAVPVLVLAAPWFLGLVVRLASRARESRESQLRAEEATVRAETETAQAREIARLRDDQTRLARDVHDVVGHSLAVILAQAESGQYLPDDDPARLKQTLATIATSARSSLQDVRQVLSSPDSTPETRPLDTLVDGVRAGGHEVVLRELGTERPLPPDLEVTAYRVLQEMLTNAVKHGRRDEPVFVERHWPDDALADELRIEVRNAIAHLDEAGNGLGLDGMRQRLDAVGGRLDVRRREEEATFTVTAWLPLGPR